jgi:hypothetical protein
MNLFIKRHKFLSISFLVIIFLIPILSFANSQFSGWRVPAYQTLKGVIYTNPSGAAAIPMVAITNTSSSNDYFVPTKTWNEYSAFIVHKPTVYR